MGREFIPAAGLSDGAGFESDVLLLDNCEGTCVWTFVDMSGDEVREFAAAAAYEGCKGLLMTTRTTDAAADDYIDAWRLVGYPEHGLLRFGGRICLPDVSGVGYVDWAVRAFSGPRRRFVELMYWPSTPEACYLDRLEMPVVVPAFAYRLVDGQWVDWEIELDLLAPAYVSLTLAGERVALPGVPCKDSAWVEPRRIEVCVGFGSAAAAPATMYVDNIYVLDGGGR